MPRKWTYKAAAEVFETGFKPNLLHMNSLLDAAESGDPAAWRRHPISEKELEAAYRATGREPRPPQEIEAVNIAADLAREPGEDREEIPG